MLRNKDDVVFSLFVCFEMDENTKKDNMDHDAAKGQNKPKNSVEYIGKVLKKYRFKLRKSNKIIFVFNKLIDK